ncbi:MAG TPA: type II toxin-antitoxin system prevent-host-death family antitoxin [Chloroflexota bacterium]|nr:type II toxin-antitoxin system prevent-host-death family antitoxin [Chloroflexota bacterium]
MRVDTKKLISVADANTLGISGLIKQAEADGERIIVRNSKPVAAIISMERLEAFEAVAEAEDDILDIALATARELTTGEHRHSLDDVLAHFGYTREQLA